MNVNDRLANLRIASIALVDLLETWEGLDAWLEAERVVGATIGRQVMDAAKPSDRVEQRVNNLAPLMDWAHAQKAATSVSSDPMVTMPSP